MSDRRVFLLLGSGINRGVPELCIPGVEELTNRILTSHGWQYIDGGRYPFERAAVDATGRHSSCGVVRGIRSLLRHLKVEAEKSFALHDHNWHPANYEDVAYLLKQLLEEEDYRLWNPAIRQFKQEADTLAQSLSDCLLDDSNRDLRSEANNLRWNFYRLCAQFVETIISTELKTTVKPTEELGGAYKVIRRLEANSSRLDIVTLNHDLLLEKTLGHGNYFDGFERQPAQVRFYEGFHPPETECVRLCKLHGSINWRSFKPLDQDDNKSGTSKLAIKAEGAPGYGATDSNGLAWQMQTYEATSHFLYGTGNKETEYLGGVFGDLYCWMRNTMRLYDRIVISGYGFKDRGVNRQLIEWMEGDANRKLVLLYDDPEAEMKTARHGIKWWWDERRQHFDAAEEKFLGDVPAERVLELACQ